MHHTLLPLLAHHVSRLSRGLIRNYIGAALLATLFPAKLGKTSIYTITTILICHLSLLQNPLCGSDFPLIGAKFEVRRAISGKMKFSRNHRTPAKWILFHAN